MTSKRQSSESYLNSAEKELFQKHNSHIEEDYLAEKFSDTSSDFSPSDVAAIIPDEVEGPALTIRMWVLAFAFASAVAGIDSFFSLRYPTITIAAVVIQVLSYPAGRLLERLTPHSKFNQKEHAAVYMFSNVVVSAGLVNIYVVEQFKFFDHDIGISKMILFSLSCYVIAFGLSTVTYDILVSPEDCVWPNAVGVCSMFKALFHKDDMKQFYFFGIVSSASFVWYWFPDLIAPFLSSIGAWISWCKPSSAVLSQVFGVSSGLGLFPLTFDWAQVASLSNPLQTPVWSLCVVFGSFVFWIWIVLPGLYYTNKWNVAHLPIMSNSIYDKHRKVYLAAKVVTRDWKLDTRKFEKYSPVYLPIGFLMSVALGLGATAAMVIDFFFKIPEIVIDIRQRKLKVTWHTFVGLFCVAAGLGLGFGFFEGYKLVGLRAGGFIISVLIGVFLFIPVAFVESKYNFTLSMASIFDLISAFWFNGQPLTLLYFYMTGFSIIQHAMHVSQSSKIGVYMKLSRREIMIVMFVASVWGSVVSPAVLGYVVEHIGDVCETGAKNNMTCRKIRNQYNTHLVWGLFGKHLFAAGGRYSWVLYFFIAGAVVALFINLMRKWRPSNLWDKLSPALIFGGAQSIPSVTGYNYLTWAAVGLFFNFYIHKRYRDWWRNYSLLLGISIDCGLAIAAIIIYFAVVYTGGSDLFKWWGTEVALKGCDHKGCSYINSNITVSSYW